MQRCRLTHTLLIALFLAGCAQPANSSPTPTRAPTLNHLATWTPIPASVKSATATPRAATATRTPQRTPTSTPTRLVLPRSAAIKDIYGYGQLLPLSCEARSASDWARHFGIKIRELEFMARLPKSKNPEEGFVGSPNGGWGQIPPDAYGVHAAPVATVLSSYGARAKAVRNLSFDLLRSEIAAGRPVIVWVTGHVEPGKGTGYKIDGKTITVARYEHTVIVTGYDEKYVTILDGKTVYKRATNTFLQSWKALENMAIIWSEQSQPLLRFSIWPERNSSTSEPITR